QTLVEDIILEMQVDTGPSSTTQEYVSEEDHSTSSSLTDTNTSLSSSDNDPSSRMWSFFRRMPSRKHKEKYALGIVTLFPSLKDPFSPKGYEHFYDAEKGTGYVSWCLKTISRNAVKRPAKMATVAQAQGPKRRRW
ncbi:hypothetical protein AMECASPLE_009568, partial [Ameca splendens]